MPIDCRGIAVYTLHIPLPDCAAFAPAGASALAGTRNAAQVCGHGKELGTLEPGKLADVIVVNGDPLTDIEVMSQVSVVIKNGQIVYPSE